MRVLADPAPEDRSWGAFEYRSCETDVLSWICEVAAGRPMPELMADLLWSRIGAQCDATIGVDADGTGFFDGGINACLTDMIRLGSLFLREGVSLTGRQVVRTAWIADTLGGGPDSRQAFVASPDDNEMPGGMYRNQMWLPYPGGNVVLCQGMCGQMIYVNLQRTWSPLSYPLSWTLTSRTCQTPCAHSMRWHTNTGSPG